MWLLPALHAISRVVTRTFYQLTIAGEALPRHGPVLLVANHPSSLLDPALVATAAGRPVRFLAKAPLFTDPLVGWMVRGGGAIPVHRRIDDPDQMNRNQQTFRAAEAALGNGAAVGIFPEGITHSEPALAPFKTGAARIALGTARTHGIAVPIVPIGITLRERERFRSKGLLLIGNALQWEDLAEANPRDADAARELTARIEEALRRLTLNLERWEDAPLLEWAEAIHAAELGSSDDPRVTLRRQAEGASILTHIRSADPPLWRAMADEIRQHAQTLGTLGLRPAELHGEATRAEAIRWTLRRSTLFLPGFLVAALGTVVFWLPYRGTGWVEQWAAPEQPLRSTYKALIGILLFSVWIALLAMIGGLVLGWFAAGALLIALPLLGVATLRVREEWIAARGEAERFFLRRGRAGLLRHLAERQRSLAERLEALRHTTTR